MKKIFSATALAMVVLMFAAVRPGHAYLNVTSTSGSDCLDCHTFAGGTGQQHTLHTATPNSLSCSICHTGGAPSKNVATAACIVCHPNSPDSPGKCNLVDLAAHPKSGSASCLTCHAAQCASTTTTTAPSGAYCTDSDNDSYGDNCTLGPDCDDSDPSIHAGCQADCTLQVVPRTYSATRALLWPVQFFMIRADRDDSISFASPICIYWESEGIDDLLKLRIGEKMIIGFVRVWPAHLTSGSFNVQVTYGDLGDTACGPIEVRGGDDNSSLRVIPQKRVKAQNSCGR